ncbi:MAG: hypothetical protein IPO83_12270 [Chitinophagaceae bacterium]|nr:hypothetical protein [Chitinophagaceae bacterium]
MKKLAGSLFIMLILSSCKKESTNPADNGPYFSQVKTIVDQHCVSCHYQGGQGMPVILTEDSDIVNNAANIKSATIDTPSWFNKRMPPDGELSDADKTTIQNWFDNGGQIDD